MLYPQHFTVPSPSTAHVWMAPTLTSTTVFQELLKRGVIVKDGSVSFIGLGNNHLRIDVSLKKQMDRLIWALTDISKSV